jgi:magnesium transporter
MISSPRPKNTRRARKSGASTPRRRKNKPVSGAEQATSQDTHIDLDAVVAALAEDNLAEVKAALKTAHAADAASFIGTLEPVQAWRVLDLMPLAKQAVVYGYLPRDRQVELARAAPRGKLARIVTEMPADERADLFNELTDEEQEALLPALAHAEREDIRKLAGYEEGTAGAIMTSDYATLSPELSAAEALEVLRREAPDKETIYRAYVTGPDRRLIGSVRLQDLILAPARSKVSQIMEANPIAVHVDEDQEEVARKIAKYDVIALPVLDADDRMVGIVTYDDALDVLQEEATEDFHRVGTVASTITNVRDASIWMLYRARVVWLVVLVFANIFSGAGIAAFEETIVAYVALMFFLPLLIGSGGNAGSQSATLMVRALATGDVRMSDWGKMIGREVLVATLLGFTMALAVSLIGLARGGPEIALVVSASMVAIVLVGSIIGISLPFILTRFGFDPATASAPLITSMADAVGVIIYFTIATTLLPKFMNF